MKRTYHVEPPAGMPLQSPRGSPPISAFASIQSPAHSQPSSRTLPSPSSYVPYPSSASSIPSSYGEPSLSTAQASHLQDLQHQISTKTLALQTLQREHDQLLAAFSRSQIRCTTLDKKSQVSDHEINTLSEDKARLQQQVEALEAQVEELTRVKDEAQQQLAADGAQWQRIMAMSSQLQIRSAEETRQYRSDKEAWERDRDGLQSRIQDLEAGRLNVGPSHPSASVTPISSDDVLASTSLDTLREEILRLRASCTEMESLLRDIQGETEHMGPTLATLTNVNERISALSSKTRSETIITSKFKESGQPGEGG
jgi:chromosome segregation ATPase